MDARELTKEVEKLQNLYYELRTKLNELEAISSKKFLKFDDMEIDVRMLEDTVKDLRRRNNG
jgi:hypothetical protein